MEPAADPPVTVAFAPPKGDRPEWAVQKLTELGVDRIVPLVAARSVVRWTGDRAAAPVERLRRVAREAAMQSRRAWLPVVEEPSSFAAVAARPGAALAVAGGDPPSLDAAGGAGGAGGRLGRRRARPPACRRSASGPTCCAPRRRRWPRARCWWPCGAGCYPPTGDAQTSSDSGPSTPPVDTALTR